MKFFGLRKGKDITAGTITSQESAKGMSLENIQRVITHFPIGFRLQYYPEYLKNKKIDTIIAAYAVNDYVIYSNRDFQIVDQEEGQIGIEMHQDGDIAQINRIHDFQILIPHLVRKEIDYRLNSDEKKKGDMVPMEKNANDFLRGNSITLFFRNPSLHGVIQLDTEVAKKVVFKAGPYSERELVMLRPLLESFECIDLRRFSRINTQIPVHIIVQDGEIRSAALDEGCFIQDFSERFVRIEIMEEHGHVFDTLSGDQDLIIKANLDEKDSELILKGSLFRKRKNNVILSLEHVMKEGTFQSIDALDEVYIKSIMLDHPNTERS